MSVDADREHKSFRAVEALHPGPPAGSGARFRLETKHPQEPAERAISCPSSIHPGNPPRIS